MSAAKVFISYSREDLDWVRSFAEALRDQGVDVWLDTWRVHPGESLADATESGLRDSDAIVAILSRTNARRPNVFFELGVAIGTGKRFIPVVPDDLERSAIPFEIRSRQFLTKGEPSDTARQLAEALNVVEAA